MPGDRLGDFLKSYDGYLRGDLEYAEMDRLWNHGMDLVRRSLASLDGLYIPPAVLVVPLREGDEPLVPRDWPTAVVTRWSGKR